MLRSAWYARPGRAFHQAVLLAGTVGFGCAIGVHFAEGYTNPMHLAPAFAGAAVGEGLNTAFEAMKRLRLRPPIIEETRSSLVVQIRHEPLATPEQSVMDYLENHSEITNRISRELTGIRSENSMKEVFYRLRASGVLAMVPGRSQARTAWQKVRLGKVADQ